MYITSSHNDPLTVCNAYSHDECVIFPTGSASGHSLLYCGPEADLCGQQPDWYQ